MNELNAALITMETAVSASGNWSQTALLPGNANFGVEERRHGADDLFVLAAAASPATRDGGGGGVKFRPAAASPIDNST